MGQQYISIMIKYINNDIERIIHHLMLNSYFINDIGMWYGQMGVVLTIADYFRYTGNTIYLDAASTLLHHITKNIDNCKTLSFSSGLLGIGWGIEYLLHHDYIEGEGVNICKSIDQNIMEINPFRISDLSLESGIMGLLNYIIYHLQGAFEKKSKLPFDERYFKDLHKLCIHLKKQNNSTAMNSLLDTYLHFFKYREINNYAPHLTDFTNNSIINLDNSINSYPIGLRTGLAGLVLNIINK